MSDMEEVSGGDVDDRREDIQEGGGPSTVEISGEAAIAGVGEKEKDCTTITTAIVSD